MAATNSDTNRINITICGDGGTGKSSITLRLVRSQWTHEYDPTIEDSYSVSRNVDGQTYLLSLTDTAGQEEYRGLQSAYARQADAFLLVYDITNPSSLHEQLPYFLDLIAMETETREDQGKVPPIKIVAGNKCDLNDDRRVTAGEGLKWARANSCGFMETSAREFVNVEETFVLLIRRVVEARQQHAAPKPSPPRMKLSTVPRIENGHGNNNKNGHAFSKTQPLSPYGEKEGQDGSRSSGGLGGGGEGGDGNGNGKKRRKWWHWMICRC